MPQAQPHILPYISLFSGGFGLDLGMEQASDDKYVFKLAACVDMDPAARQTIRQNRPNVTVIGDLEDEAGGDLSDPRLSSRLILRRAGLRARQASLVVGGPPCQSWSILGKRQGFADARGNLILRFVQIVREVQPRAFIMENVEGFLTQDGGKACDAVLKQFRDAGYPHLFTWRLNAADYGVPQHRKRAFIIGFRRDHPHGLLLAKPAPTHRPQVEASTDSVFDIVDDRPAYRCVGDVLRNIPEDIPNHIPRVHGERVRTRYSALAPGERDRVDHTDRLRWDQPSGTVLVGSSDGGARPFIHPEEPRHITVREAARLQGFPDSWAFSGNQTDQYRQVGNAVPPPLMAVVARQVARFLCSRAIYKKQAKESRGRRRGITQGAPSSMPPSQEPIQLTVANSILVRADARNRTEVLTTS
jgi:DNA (cytosine-5)-methyltransferase 1